MNFSSKSILSPGHSDKSREPTLSFSSSLSRRRLRSNGSISSSSPMFPTGSKKRGCAFDTPEPSSPKVTCIGQVRVNTKKKKKKKQQGKNRNGDVVSFRKATTDHHNNHQEEGIDCLPHRNPKWVHLPFTICEALRSFGADFNCFQPCGGRSCSSASTSERDNKEEKRTTTIPSGRTTATTSSCGAIFLRWLMALQEGERVEEKRRRMEIGEEEEEEEVERDRIKLVDEMEIEEEEEERREIDEEELEEARVSICIPPKNALLLMRCRSDPLRMSSLANRFWDSPVTKEVEDDDDDDDDEYYDQESEGDDDDEVQEERRDQQEGMKPELEMNQEIEDDDEVEVEGRDEQQQEEVEEMDPQLEEKHNLDKIQEKSDSEEDTLDEEQVSSVEGDNNNLEEEEEEEEEVVVMVNGFSPVALESPKLEEPKLQRRVTDDAKEERLELDNGFSPETENLEEPKLEERLELDNGFFPETETLEEPKLEERVLDAEKHEEVVNGSSSSSPEALEIPKLQEREVDAEKEEEEEDERKEGSSSSSSEVEEFIQLLEEEPTLAEEVAILYLDERIEKSIEEEKEKKDTVEKEEEEEIHVQGNEVHKSEENERIVHQLPDCLLLMLCEPKLSMEVSKETWVCSTDFIRKKHRREVMLINGGDLCKKRINFNSDSNPTAEAVVAHPHPPPLMASLIEQKLVNAVAYEPLVLTRCKSEPPLRSFSAKLGF